MSSRLTLPGGIVLALFALGAGVAFARHAPAAAPPPFTASIPEQQSYWTARIRAIGGAPAYEEFARFVAPLRPQQQHQEAHVFGGALYSAEGVNGLSVCDSRFSFGCYHEFLGQAIASLGFSSVDMLNQKCVDALGNNSLSCQHGIGHGVLAYLGYTFPDLQKALGVCENLPYNDPIGGCYGGVFMEYNLQTMLGTDGTVRKNSGDAYAPCDRLPDTYATSCYFWQPQWWRQTLRMQGVTDNDAAYAQVGKWCAGAPAQFARSCFEGIGNNIPADANFDGATARRYCIDATSDAQDQLYCRSLAADSLFNGGAGQRGDSLTLCQGLTGNPYEYCAAYASNRANIAAPIESMTEITH